MSLALSDASIINSPTYYTVALSIISSNTSSSPIPTNTTNVTNTTNATTGKPNKTNATNTSNNVTVFTP